MLICLIDHADSMPCFVFNFFMVLTTYVDILYNTYIAVVVPLQNMTLCSEDDHLWMVLYDSMRQLLSTHAHAYMLRLALNNPLHEHTLCIFVQRSPNNNSKSYLLTSTAIACPHL